VDFIQKGKEVDRYFHSRLVADDPVMEDALKRNADNDLPPIDVSPSQGKLLYLLVKMKGVKSILEIGTLGAYSTIWMARALPSDGRIVTLEADTKHAEVAKQNLVSAGVADQVEIVVGKALDTLPSLKEKASPPFDFIFIDADKKNNSNYVKWALEYSLPGTVIIVDNVVRGGKVMNHESEDESIRGTRDCIDLLAAEERIDATAIQTLGSKGYDGFVMGIVSE
jgi:predicted O-methyltransferase YrrM